MIEYILSFVGFAVLSGIGYVLFRVGQKTGKAQSQVETLNDVQEVFDHVKKAKDNKDAVDRLSDDELLFLLREKYTRK